MTVENFLKITFIFVTLNSLDDLTRFEDKHGWDCRDTVLNGKLHVVTHIHFADPGVSCIVDRKFINDWTQSFARWSALGPEINQNRFFSTQHLGFKCLFCKFNCHDLSQI